MTAVTPITIKGKPYIQVAGRVSLAHDDGSFSMLSSETFSVNARWFVQVTITVKDKQYIGTSEIKFDAPKNSADGTNPVSCAETSATGRALGMAGIGSVDSIASADEVLRAQAEQQRPASQPQDGKILPSQFNALKNIYIKKNQEIPEDLKDWTFAKARQTILDLQAS